MRGVGGSDRQSEGKAILGLPLGPADPFFACCSCMWRFKVGPSLAVALVGVDGRRDLLEEGRTEETVSS